MLAAMKEIFSEKMNCKTKTYSHFILVAEHLFSPDEIKSLIDEVLKHFSFEKDIEIT
jgi:oxygen-independent coproporphyrinogen-3 oxidase